MQLDQIISINKDSEHAIDRGRKLLFELKISLKTIIQNKNNIFVQYKVG